MTTGVVARRYAVAIFELAKASALLEKIGSDLRAIVDAMQAKPEVLRFFVSPVVDRGEKAALLERAFSWRIDRTALNALLLLVRKRREALLPAIVAEYEKLVLAENNRESLEVVSARALSAGELDEMVARLGRAYGKQFEVTTTVDPALLGGLQITMGDRYIDGSVSGRLDELARELFAKQ